MMVKCTQVYVHAVRLEMTHEHARPFTSMVGRTERARERERESEEQWEKQIVIEEIEADIGKN